MKSFFSRRRRPQNPLDELRRAVAARFAAHRASGVHDPDLDASLMFVWSLLESERRREGDGARSRVLADGGDVEALLSGLARADAMASLLAPGSRRFDE